MRFCLCQLEFANVIVMSKMDLMDESARVRLRAILRRFNPDARLVEATWGRVAPKSVLGTGLFDMAKAKQHPDWLKEARKMAKRLFKVSSLLSTQKISIR